MHGAWDEWSPWSLCSSTCGRGYRSRTRTCTPPQFGGDPCEGPEKQTKFCNIAVCPGEKHTNTCTKNKHIPSNPMFLAKCFHRTMQKAIVHSICSKKKHFWKFGLVGLLFFSKSYNPIITPMYAAIVNCNSRQIQFLSHVVFYIFQAKNHHICVAARMHRVYILSTLQVYEDLMDSVQP